MAIPDLSIRLTLSGLRPTAARLRQLVARFQRWGYRSLYLDWMDSFPWTLDDRFRRESTFREELVAGLYREAQAQGLALCTAFPGPDELGFASRLSSYRHLFRTKGGRATLDLTKPAARKFLEDLIDDFLALVPEPGGILLTYASVGTASQWVRICTEAFRARGLAVIHRYCAAWGTQSVTEEDLSTADAVILPYSMLETLGPRSAKRITWELPVLTPKDRSTAQAVLRRHRSATGRQRTDNVESLLLSFQPDHRCGDPQDGAGREGALQGSIEPVLSDVRSIAVLPREADEDEVEDEGWKPMLDEYQHEIDDGWRCVRRLREECAAFSIPDGSPFGFDRRTLEALNAHRARSAELSERLVSLLSSLIEADRLRRALTASVVALDEEYYLLRSRIAGVDRG